MKKFVLSLGLFMLLAAACASNPEGKDGENTSSTQQEWSAPWLRVDGSQNSYNNQPVAVMATPQVNSFIPATVHMAYQDATVARYMSYYIDGASHYLTARDVPGTGTSYQGISISRPPYTLATNNIVLILMRTNSVDSRVQNQRIHRSNLGVISFETDWTPSSTGMISLVRPEAVMGYMPDVPFPAYETWVLFTTDTSNQVHAYQINATSANEGVLPITTTYPVVPLIRRIPNSDKSQLYVYYVHMTDHKIHYVTLKGGYSIAGTDSWNDMGAIVNKNPNPYLETIPSVIGGGITGTLAMDHNACLYVTGTDGLPYVNCTSYNKLPNNKDVFQGWTSAGSSFTTGRAPSATASCANLGLTVDMCNQSDIEMYMYESYAQAPQEHFVSSTNNPW